MFDIQSWIIGDHPTGMLDRDQRTIIIPKLRKSAKPIYKCIITGDCVRRRCSSDLNKIIVNNCDSCQSIRCYDSHSKLSTNAGFKSSMLIRKTTVNGFVCQNIVKKHTILSFIKKTNDNFLVSLSLWLLAFSCYLVPVTYAKPFEHFSPSSSSSLQYNLTPTSGLALQTMFSDNSTDDVVKKMLNVIAQQTKNALAAANKSIEIYVNNVWNRTDIDVFYKEWHLHQEEWLYADNKKLDELFNDPDLINRETVKDNTKKLINDTIVRFDRLILGFKHIINNCSQISPKKKVEIDIFNTTLHELEMVLDEIHMLAGKWKLPKTFVSENEMPRDESAIFNWVILREFVNQLKYLYNSLNTLRNSGIYSQMNFL